MEATYIWPPWLSESYHPRPVITPGEGFTCSFCDRKIPLATAFVCCRLCGHGSLGDEGCAMVNAARVNHGLLRAESCTLATAARVSQSLLRAEGCAATGSEGCSVVNAARVNHGFWGAEGCASNMQYVEMAGGWTINVCTHNAGCKISLFDTQPDSRPNMFQWSRLK